MTIMDDPGSRLKAALSRSVLGQDRVLDEVLIALVAGGHVLLEGVPGVAKTTLAKSVAHAVGGSFRRIQFTPDMMPSDIIGTRVFDPKEQKFEYVPGPVFANCLLCDEINRTPPRTQSAVLELMEERQVTVFGESRALPAPFFVIATQNPLEQEGVYPLAEAQIDRFLFKVLVDLPAEEQEIEIVRQVIGLERRDLPAPSSVLAIGELAELQRNAAGVFVHRDLIRFAVRLSRSVSRNPRVRAPLGPRATISISRAAQARAALAGRDHVEPHDVIAVFRPATRHRVLLTPDAQCEGVRADEILGEALEAEKAPAPPERKAVR